MSADVSKPTTSVRRPRRWFRYSLRTLLVVMTVFGLWLGFQVHAARQQANAVAALRAMGASVRYGYEDRGAPTGPQWLTDLVGVDFFNEVALAAILDGRPVRFSDALPHLHQFTELETLWFFVDVTDADVEHLLAFKHLRALMLRNGSITNEGLARLASHLELRHLALDGSQIDDEGLRHLARLPHLETLSLSVDKVSDDGLKHLVRLPMLTSLTITYTQVTDAGLETVRQLPKLIYIDLRQTRVTAEGVARLKKDLPRLTIMDNFTQFPSGQPF